MELNNRIPCPAKPCNKWFKNVAGLTSHLGAARKCAWYKKGKLRELLPVDVDEADGKLTVEEEEVHSDEEITSAKAQSGTEAIHEDIDEEDPGAVMDDYIPEELFHFVPDESSGPDIGEAGPGPSTTSQMSSEARRKLHHCLDDDEDERVEDIDADAGRPIRMDKSLHQQWQELFGPGKDREGDVIMGDGTFLSSGRANGFAPFASELDWRVANWAITEGVGHNSFNRLLAIPGVQDSLGLSFNNIRSLHQKLDDIPPRAGKWRTKKLRFLDRPDDIYRVRCRDPLEAIKSLLGDPAHTNEIVYAPRKIFSSQARDNRIYTEMWTGKWWHAVQKLLPKGAALAPVIIASDKTQLTQFSGSKAAYPVYLTLGNLPRSIRRKPSKHAAILIAYLSVDKISRIALTKNALRARNQQLFHESMRLVLEPLKKAGQDGVQMIGGDGKVRQVHPILASYVADYPEQCLVTCTKYGTCPRCQCTSQHLGDQTSSPDRVPSWTEQIMADAKAKTKTRTEFHEFCMSRGVSSSVDDPFWKDFPYTNINLSITPDVLHQLYQGVLKHLISWVQLMMSHDELDARIRSLPPVFGIRHFKNGISCLSQISGSERKHMAKILLGCLVGAIPKEAIRACRAILDFIYLAQYSSHDDKTLVLMDDALDAWHANKNCFVESGAREDFNIPKFHSLKHYVQSIRLFGTTDNYNTEMFERLHIDFAKKGWRASNHRDAFPQMVTWLSRQEKMAAFNNYLAHVEINRQKGGKLVHGGNNQDSNEPEAIAVDATMSVASTRPRGNSNSLIFIAKIPPSPSKLITRIEETHCAPSFSLYLREFLNKHLDAGQRTSNRRAQDYPLPFHSLDVFHQFKFTVPAENENDLNDTVKAIPRSKDNPTGRFDTVVFLNSADAQSVSLTGCQVGRVRVIFRLPAMINRGLGPVPSPDCWPQGPLAYLELYSRLKSTSEKDHGMYAIRKVNVGYDSGPKGIVIPLSQIRQSCMLFPSFGRKIDSTWTSENVLDKCDSFFVNNWSNLYGYQSIY